MKNTVLILFTVFLYGCTTLSNLNKNSSVATAAHISREQQKNIGNKNYYVKVAITDSLDGFIIPQSEYLDGELVAKVELQSVTVTAKSRSLPERNGKVKADFTISVPADLVKSSRSIVVKPVMITDGTESDLEPIILRGGLYDKIQRRGYWQHDRYNTNNPDGDKGIGRFVKFPYSPARMDSLTINKEVVNYHYSQDIPIEGIGKRFGICLSTIIRHPDGKQQ